MSRWLFISAAALVVAFSFTRSSGALGLEEVASGLDQPVEIRSAPGDSERLFVLEKSGRILVLAGGELVDSPFLDLSDRVSSGGEQGLLSFAFRPDYADSRFFYVSYTDAAGDSVLARFRRTRGNPDRARKRSERIVLGVDQPFTNHNGGQLQFGPDGMLYLGLGDGGSAGDPLGSGQDPFSLLGKILRLDVSRFPYEIPSDNPFAAGAQARPEIWASGLRNPWRFSFDRRTGDLFVGDVGQDELEEVDFAPAESTGGENYGWNVMEGRECYADATCDDDGLVLPVHQYRHDEGCSITGGYRYRGEEVPELLGRYVFADYCSGRVWSFRVRNGRRRDLQEHTVDVTPPAGFGGLAGFGEDDRGELYLCDLSGTVYRFIP